MSSDKIKKYKRKFVNINDIAFREAVIQPKEYIKSLQSYLDTIEKKSFVGKTPERIVAVLNSIFLFRKIKFTYNKNIANGSQEYIQLGINAGGTEVKSKKIIIELNPNILILSKDRHKKTFIKFFIFILSHELIHREQMLRIKNSKILYQLDNSNETDIKKYLSGRYELMARAWEIIEYFHFMGATDEDIKEILSGKNKIAFNANNLLLFFHRNFDKDSAVIKKLYKYMYQYVTGQTSVLKGTKV